MHQEYLKTSAHQNCRNTDQTDPDHPDPQQKPARFPDHPDPQQKLARFPDHPDPQ
ncbi:hypothetical protein PTTG_00608 [Puccinia triticina 1-1 BBBD Race 1]|uniref:Uncharacterized protein n=1 Tax=Puccinia triticina (isolate 1-1 / race 1 (BBBD)) TaxID=630390 RepID=A0A0C4EIP1_PUCT1|nr:hypothetical protein PTTG_00608 [Puccinia triticina 1-1 BBBD Race 1]